MLDQPMRHLMRHGVGQKCMAVFIIERGIEAQSTTTKMGLTGTLSTQVKPDIGARQGVMYFSTEHPSLITPLKQHLLTGSGVQPCQPISGNVRKYGSHHE